MGLDIVYYERFTLLDPQPTEEEAKDLVELGDCDCLVEQPFMESFGKVLQPGKWYKRGDRTGSFRAGSYSYYNRFREESMARPVFTNIIVAEGDKETDEAFWSAVSRLKKSVEQEYVEVYGDEEQRRWVDGGWIAQEGWSPERSFALMVGTEFVGLVTAVATETGIPSG